MIYNDFKELSLSGLGFGTMRLPMTEAEDGTKVIDRPQVAQMVDYAISHGINYFDTAYPYHDGLSEVVIGEALAKYPRESWMLADKFPGHQTASSYEPAPIFEHQLRKCGVEYFDFYLMHNVNENCLDVYHGEKWGILDYFLEQKRQGRIRHLGFSSHAEPAALEAFLESEYGPHMEFCQIQLNYLDWDLQKAREKVEILNRHNIPIWVMEPLRGGKLASSTEAVEKAFRWLQGVPGVTIVLSGMSSFEQMQQNISFFEERKPLDEEQIQELYHIAEGMRGDVPCTGCRYCCGHCPMGLEIPVLMQAYNDLKVETSFTPLMRIEGLGPDLHPSNCLGCGACADNCPQKIDIPGVIEKLNVLLENAPSWAAICAAREKVAKNLREQ